MTQQARFLVPREWGIEPLYARQTRERSDGSADTWEELITIEQQIPAAKLYAGYGLYHRPDVKDAVHNKYGVPSFTQLVLGIDGQFPRISALSYRAFLAHKWAWPHSAHRPDDYFNKVDMTNYNLIVNYRF